MKTAKLIMVTGDNNNKYYTMKQINDNEFESEWGRVDVTSTKKVYGMEKWASTYKEKTRKGYKDVTELFVEGGGTTNFADITDHSVKQIVGVLQAFAANTVTQNYKITAAQVTPKQLETAQDLLNTISKTGKVEEVNEMLLELYSVIPRRMSRVQDHLLEKKVTKATWDRFVGQQQDILDALSSQVSTLNVAQTSADQTLLQALGLGILAIDENDEKVIRKKLEENKDQFSKGFKIIHTKSRNNYEAFVKDTKHKESDLLWHGSRNENWWSILQTGLLLRPTNAVITGKMFGYGIYFADRSRKSIGYTSYRGSYWAKGNNDRAYLALFDVHTGKQLELHDSDSSLTASSLKSKGDYDSVFAKAGRSLINNEFIIYNQNQCSIKYLVEIK